MQYPLSSFFLRGCVARRSKAAHISRSSPHQVLGNSHEKRLDVDEVLYQHYVKKLLVGYLNKGESLHALRDFLFVGDKGVIRRKQYEAQTNQAMCLNVVTNAVVVWNTVYMQAVLDQLRAEGYRVQEEDLAHLSPARFEHVNPYGK